MSEAPPSADAQLVGDERPLTGRVAIVTGAGAGLGRAHAKALARAGALVMVNDLPSAQDAAADTVAAIEAEGGGAALALAAAEDPDSGPAIVRAALEHHGRLDIVVANAGILRSETFPHVSTELWDLHRAVHVDGTFHLARAAWPHLEAAEAGRLVLTTSAGGLFGAHGLSAYGASKMAVVGLLRVLAVEAADTSIRVNAVAPLAWTPMSQAGGRTGSTAQILGPDHFASFSPSHVSEMVVALSHPDCPAQGRILSVGGGHVAEVFIAETQGYTGDPLDWRGVLQHWSTITDTEAMSAPRSMRDALAAYAPPRGHDQAGP